MPISEMSLAAGTATAIATALTVRWLVSPQRPLKHRLRPYLSPSVSPARHSGPATAVGRLFGPMVEEVAHWLGRLLDRAAEPMTVTKLRQAGWYRGQEGADMLAAYRVGQLRALSIAMAGTLAIGVALKMPPTSMAGLVAMGGVVGVTRQKGRLERAIADRRERMRIEVYTINQLLAMRVRAGGGIVQAVNATVNRGRGEVVSELGDALRLHRSGWSAGEAFRRVAELTAEPYCGRTYRLLASAEERGADLAGALLDLAEDVRESRRESIKRSATKRRAAMLVPTIAILAPVLILFVAAPLPYLITGWN